MYYKRSDITVIIISTSKSIYSWSLDFYAMSYLCKSMKLSFMNTHSQKPNEVENKYLFSTFLDSFCEYAAST